MKYQFRPYAKMQPTEVKLTSKVYEKGEHPLYTEHKIIEVVDEEGETHYAFEDELTSDEVKEQERSYSEEDIALAFNEGQAYSVTGKLVDGKEWLKAHKKEWFENFKNK